MKDKEREAQLSAKEAQDAGKICQKMTVILNITQFTFDHLEEEDI